MIEQADRVEALAHDLNRLGLVSTEVRDLDATCAIAGRLPPHDALVEIDVSSRDGPWLIYTLFHLAQPLCFRCELIGDAVPAVIVRRQAGVALDYVALLDRLFRLPTVLTLRYPVVGVTVCN